MRKSSLYLTAGLLAAIIALLHSCKKVNGVDNGQIIETPYSLYFADSAGALYNSNDGVTYVKTFPADGLPSRALITSGNYILWAKTNLIFSNNNGVDFNQAFDSLQFSANIASWFTHAENGFPIDLNQSMIINVPGSPDVVYACSDVIHAPLSSPPSADYLGIEFNNNNGVRGNWSPDNSYDSAMGQTGEMPVQMVSFALMPNGYLLGLAVSEFSNGAPDGIHFRNFYNTNPSNVNSVWEECTGSGGTGGPPIGGTNDTSGYSLPPNSMYPNDTPFFTLGSYNARAIAIDEKGKDGAWYSDDNGRTWAQYSGLPANTPLLCVASPFNQVAMIGTQGQGLYIYNVNTATWQQNTAGLTNNLIVRGIVGKENIYKNDTKVMYIYLATNQGIYQSTDMGLHWTLKIPGNFVSIF